MRAALAAALIAALAVAPAALADNRPSGLFDPAVSPTTATTSTQVTFSVTVRGPGDWVSGYVAVVVGPTSHPMQRVQGTGGTGTGARYTVSMQLPAGTWPVTFVAGNPQHPAFTLPGPGVSIAPPPAPPVQTGAPAPPPAPTPPPAPAEQAGVAVLSAVALLPRGAVPDPESWNDPAWNDPAWSGSSPAGSSSLGWGSAAGRYALDLESSGAGADAVPSLDALPAAATGVDSLPRTGPGAEAPPRPGPFPSSTGPADLSYGPITPATVLAAIARALPTAVVTTGGVSMAMAFLMFGKRRRDEEPTASDEELGAAAAVGVGMPEYAALLATIPAPAEAEADMPRWRRPSLMAARKADPLRTASTETHLRFTGDAGAVLGGFERRLIRYRLVRLLDIPDEVRGVEIDVLDQGDEVVLLERRGTYWRVLCPDGVEGWLHKMTLGDVIGAGGDQPVMAGDDEVGLGTFESILRLAAREAS